MLRALGLGDLLTSVPALRALRRAYPQATISVAAPVWLAPVVDLIEAVDRLLPVEPLAPLPLEAAGAGLAVNLHGRGPQSTARLLEAAPAFLLAYAHPELPCTAGGAEWNDSEHEVRRWCRLLEYAGLPADPGDLLLQRIPAVPAVSPRTSADARPAADAPIGRHPPIVLHLGASAAARRWPWRRWAAVAAALRQDGHRVVLTGSRGDRETAERVRRALGLPAADVLAGRTTLEALLAVVASARLVVVGDTGVAHVASAYGVASVVLFGPVSPAQWGPPPGPHRALWAGRLGDPHARRADQGLLLITADVVVAEARMLLAARSATDGGAAESGATAS